MGGNQCVGSYRIIKAEWNGTLYDEWNNDRDYGFIHGVMPGG
jgi:hypothetical protein